MQNLKIAIFVSLIITSQGSWASNNAAAFLRQSPNPVTAGLGGGGSSLLEGPDAQLINPAGLQRNDRVPGYQIQVMGMTAYGAQTSLIQGSKQGKYVAFGASYLRSGVTGIPGISRNPLTDRLERTDRNLTYDGDAISLGVAKTMFEDWGIIKQLTVGANAKRVQEKAAGYRSVGTGADLGLQVALKGPVKIGISAQNIIQPELKWNTPSKSVDTVPTVIQVGTSYDITSKATLTLDARLRDNRSGTLLLGALYQLTEEFSLLGGINDSTWALGTGMQFGPLGLDFAWVHPTGEGLDDIYQVAMNYRFISKK